MKREASEGTKVLGNASDAERVSLLSTCAAERERYAQKAAALKKRVAEGWPLLKTLCYLSCFFSVYASLQTLSMAQGKYMELKGCKIFISLNICVLSMMGVVFESAVGLRCSLFLKRNVSYWMKFMRRTWGRGIFYFYLGCMEVFLSPLLQPLALYAGITMATVGIICFFAGYFANRRLVWAWAEMHSTHCGRSDSEMRLVFDRHDLNKNHTLEASELASVAAELGSPLSKMQLTALFFILDKDNSGGLSFDEFKAWWQGDANRHYPTL
eukprot:gb/GEZN01010695.1/.p1 GENE.gb/GEZN01010695.1/~~gb/GEZN01010695.1/.p1  ORF type:complete len:269 (-),score=32.93 gb/GEZN01010695.1/:390-1196(-)